MSCSTTPQHGAAAEMLLISPMAIGGLGLYPKKRRITPTAEAESPKRIAIITSPGCISPLLKSIARSSFPNPLGWSSQAELAHIDQRLPIPNPPLQDNIVTKPPVPDLQAQDLQEPPLARHLILSFDLQNDRSALNDPQNRHVLRNIFPGTIGIGIDGWCLYLQLRTLPPKPWPLSIAGLPLYLHQEIGQSPLPQARPVSRKNGSVAEDRNGRDMEDWKPLFHAIKTHFQGLMIPITEVMYYGNTVFIVLKHRDTNVNKLPWRAANIVCNYLFDDEMGRPLTPQARRLLDPAPGNPDVSQYDTLQPGLRVASSHMPGSAGMFLSTTTGVLLKDKVGNEFVTVAAHGFPGECGTQVFHTFPGTGRRIGDLIMQVSHTDIALVKLQDAETFSNVTFQNHRTPEPIQLKRMVSAQNYQRFGLICLDSPDTGFIDGQFMLSSYQATPSGDNSPEQEWVLTTWSYMGQDSAENLPEGMCGSAIWNEDGDVLGLFRHAPQEGVMKDWCAGIAADELIDRGYTLVNTSQRT